MATFAVTLDHGERWDSARGIREQENWPAHAAFMDSLVEDGFVIVGGPLGDDQALLAVEAADEEAVRDRLAADPWAPARLLHVGSVRPWPLWLDSRAQLTGLPPDGH